MEKDQSLLLRQILLCNKLNWHYWYVLEDFKDLVATQKFKTYNWLQTLDCMLLSWIVRVLE